VTKEISLRMWPGFLIVATQWLLRFVVPLAVPDAVMAGVLGGLLGGVAVVVWWAFFSRARWADRIAGVLAMVTGLAGTARLVDISLATGAQGLLFPLLAMPGLCLAFVLWAWASQRWGAGTRRAALAAAVAVSCGVWTLVKTGGFSGDFDIDLMWRWAKSAEERLVAAPAEVPVPVPVAAPAPAPAAAVKEVAVPAPVPAAWPAFRGADGDGVVRDGRIEIDWGTAPPVEIWRRAIGPGWSSFAVDGELLYTQEQRGEEEIVACYRVANGKPVWMHKDAARFWESNAGPGPRATPALHGGRVYTLGATGIVNALEARTGAAVWTRNAAEDTGAKRPEWGFSGSPLVVGDLVVVAASGRLAAYELATGKLRWMGPDGGGTSYSSPRLVTIGGVRQVLLVSATGARSVDAASGGLLWEHAWKGYPIVQPAVTAEGDILVSVNQDSGTRRLQVRRQGDAWAVEERWTTNGLKPYFNDFVVHKGHAYGFDGSILACIDLADGKRKWKGGRYGQGQMVLLEKQDLLLVLSEDGELVLVRATAEGFREVARRAGITGKTWNHPVMTGGVLLVRNGEEMAAFRVAAE
jgi:outer membrane protein assembly factor BamB